MSTQIARTAAPLIAALTADKEKPTRKRKIYPPFKDYILQTLAAIEQDGKDADRRYVKACVEAHNFYAGRQVGYVSNLTYEFIDTQPADDPYQVDNIVQPAVDILETEMSRVKIDIKAEAKHPDDPKHKEGAEKATEILRDELKRLKDAFFTQRENKFSVITGDYIRFTFTDDDPDSRPYKIPKSANGVLPPAEGGGVYVCPECGEGESATDGAQKLCPDCLKPMTLVTSGPVETVSAEYEEQPARKVTTISVDPISVKFSARARRPVMDSPYWWWRNRVLRSVLEEAHPDKDIPSTGIKSEALRYQQQLEEQANRANGNDIWDTDTESERVPGGSQFEEVEHDLIWLEPYVYAAWRAPKDETLPSGQKIKKGEGLKHCPDGLLIEKVGTEILDERNDRRRDKWVFGVYRMIPTSAHGGSISGIINDNKQLNELRNLQFYSALYNGAGREIYNKAKIVGGNLSGDPSKAIAAENLEEGDSLLTDVVVRLPGTNGIPEAEQLREQIESSTQNKTGALPTNLAAASQDVKSLGTATAVTVQREVQVGRMGPSQWLRSQVDEEHGYQVLIAKQMILRERAVVDPSVMQEPAMKWFLECDVRRDLNLEAVEGTWMPETASQRQAYFDRFLQIATIPGLPRPYVEYAAELLKMPFEVDPSYMVRQEAQVRLDAILQTAQMVEEETAVLDADGAILPQAIARVFKFADVEMDKDNDQHPLFMQFYQEWLLGTEARRSSKFQRAVVRDLLRQHREASVEQQTQANADQLKARAPELGAKQIMDEQQLHVDQERAEAERAQAQDDAEHAAGVQLLTAHAAPGAPAAESPHPALQMAESLSLKFADLKNKISPLQAQALEAVGFQVDPSMIATETEQQVEGDAAKAGLEMAQAAHQSELRMQEQQQAKRMETPSIGNGQ
jgi:hypothetical protein